MSRLLEAAYRMRGLWLALVSLGLLLSMLHLLLLLAPLEPSVLALQFTWTPQQFWQVFGRWDAGNQALYRSHFRHDHLFALLYGAWGALLVASSPLFNGLGTAWRWRLAAILPSAAVADLLENACHLALLAGPVGAGDGLVPLAASFSALKWLLASVFLGALLWRCWRAWAAPVNRWLELRVPPLALTLAAALAMLGISALLPGWAHRLPRPLALGLMGLGTWLALAAVAAFRRAHTTVNPVRVETARSLVATGVYSFCRNPMYLGLIVMQAGWSAWLGHPLAALVVPAQWAYLHRFQVLPEERALEAQFGPAFRLYCERVRRWL